MAQIAIIAGSTRVVSSDFARGTHIARVIPSLRRPTEQDILARALWLERHGRESEAVEYLDRACGEMH